ncbi:MAG: Hypothetical protein BHV28_12210 [Candidatus Tokpelaia hoelldobleri]|uniref:Uncharacterized protein n=1 Tax=Candidatus Tokpelaia hoelldobleri TaxID=1902579 RepID=A0A1U9JVJ9_9HYPH|nr:MAG: Hypothetical protein BHV28_12210 [Candidatus Tokpelaia hoelldoblerii]
MRWVLRCVAVICLIVAIAAAVFDAALSVSSARFVFVPLGEVLASLGIMAKTATWAPVTQAGGSVIAWWNHISAILLQLPTWLLFGMVSLLFFVAGYQRRA